MSKSHREAILEEYINQLKREFEIMNRLHLITLTTIVHYVGGTLTLSKRDYTEAMGLMLTEETDPVAELRTFRVRTIGQDGGDEVAKGGLLPPDAGAREGHTEVNGEDTLS